jgi:uncharacterized metal-binding protein YceD (DUF177 family)
MRNLLRDRRKPKELAANSQVIEITEKICDFKRLEQIVGGDLDVLEPAKIPTGWRKAVVSGELRFGFADAQKALPAVEGEVVARLQVVCQRCLEPMPLRLCATVRLLFAEQPDEGLEGFEVWEMDEERLRPLDLVEELLIMELPFSAVHVDDAACKVVGTPDNAASGEVIRPFAGLRTQMEKEN